MAVVQVLNCRALLAMALAACMYQWRNVEFIACVKVEERK